MVLSEPLSTITVCVLTRASKNLKYVRLSDNHFNTIFESSILRENPCQVHLTGNVYRCTRIIGEQFFFFFFFSFVLFLFYLFIYLFDQVISQTDLSNVPFALTN